MDLQESQAVRGCPCQRLGHRAPPVLSDTSFLLPVGYKQTLVSELPLATEDSRQYLAFPLPSITFLLASFELSFCMLRCDICGP